MPKRSLQDELQDYAALFVAVKEIIDEIPNELLTKKPGKNKWSIKEILCHLVDADLMFAMRMKLIIAGNDPVLPAYDQDKWAEKFKYSEWDLKETLLLFGLSRNSMTRILNTIPAAAWRRTGRHEERGKVTLRSVLDDSNQHCKHHLAQIISIKLKLERS